MKAPKITRLITTTELANLRPQCADELHQFMNRGLGIQLPRKAIVDGHGSEPRFLAEKLSTSVQDINKRMKRLRGHGKKVMEQ